MIQIYLIAMEPVIDARAKLWVPVWVDDAKEPEPDYVVWWGPELPRTVTNNLVYEGLRLAIGAALRNRGISSVHGPAARSNLGVGITHELHDLIRAELGVKGLL